MSKITVGGATRQQSVFIGLKEADKRCRLVAVHDGARPFVTVREIEDAILGAVGCAVVVATKVSETIKTVDGSGFVCGTPQRERLWAAKTPQIIPADILLKAYEKADAHGFTATDDASLVEFLGYPVKVIEGSVNNIKITTDRDLIVSNITIY